jgi:hypothetical protein
VPYTDPGVQASPNDLQVAEVQTFPWQVKVPQHWYVSVQDSPDDLQVEAMQTLPIHESPEQQLAEAPQEPPADTHAAQWSSLQLRPEQQSSELTQSSP